MCIRDRLYSGDRPIGLFVEKLSYNLGKLNAVFDDIAYLFKNAGIPDFEKLPADGTVRAKFASLFRDFNGYLEAEMCIRDRSYSHLLYCFSWWCLYDLLFYRA